MELKAVIVGDADVGKTSLSSRFCHGVAPNVPTPTIGASFLQKKITVKGARANQPRDIMLQIWDTAGQERFRSMAPMYYRGARAALIVFDVTKPNSFEGVEAWRRDLKKYAEAFCVVAVAGNKADQEHPDFDGAHAKEVCESLGVPFLLTSAITGENVDEIFGALVDRAVENSPEFVVNESEERADVDLNAVASNQKKNKGCC